MQVCHGAEAARGPHAPAHDNLLRCYALAHASFAEVRALVGSAAWLSPTPRPGPGPDCPAPAGPSPGHVHGPRCLAEARGSLQGALEALAAVAEEGQRLQVLVTECCDGGDLHSLLLRLWRQARRQPGRGVWLQASGGSGGSSAGGAPDRSCPPRPGPGPGLDPLATVQAALDVARGVATLHAAGLTHGRLEPRTVLCATYAMGTAGGLEAGSGLLDKPGRGQRGSSAEAPAVEQALAATQPPCQPGDAADVWRSVVATRGSLDAAQPGLCGGQGGGDAAPLGEPRAPQTRASQLKRGSRVAIGRQSYSVGIAAAAAAAAAAAVSGPYPPVPPAAAAAAARATVRATSIPGTLLTCRLVDATDGTGDPRPRPASARPREVPPAAVRTAAAAAACGTRASPPSTVPAAAWPESRPAGEHSLRSARAASSPAPDCLPLGIQSTPPASAAGACTHAPGGPVEAVPRGGSVAGGSGSGMGAEWRVPSVFDRSSTRGSTHQPFRGLTPDSLGPSIAGGGSSNGAARAHGASGEPRASRSGFLGRWHLPSWRLHASAPGRAPRQPSLAPDERPDYGPLGAQARPASVNALLQSPLSPGQHPATSAHAAPSGRTSLQGLAPDPLSACLTSVCGPMATASLHTATTASTASTATTATMLLSLPDGASRLPSGHSSSGLQVCLRPGSQLSRHLPLLGASNPPPTEGSGAPWEPLAPHYPSPPPSAASLSPVSVRSLAGSAAPMAIASRTAHVVSAAARDGKPQGPEHPAEPLKCTGPSRPHASSAAPPAPSAAAPQQGPQRPSASHPAAPQPAPVVSGHGPGLPPRSWVLKVSLPGMAPSGGSGQGPGLEAGAAGGALARHTCAWPALAYMAPEAAAALDGWPAAGPGMEGPAEEQAPSGAAGGGPGSKEGATCPGSPGAAAPPVGPAILMGLLSGDLDLALEWPEDVDPELAELGRACMRREPDSRPSAQEVVAALEGVLSRMGRTHPRP
ncbi:hypothetical protein HYH03_017714 [Edaphochlamys debaryana]|uniref:Protein kinase domain-containing protein n=1 Tax=Edaphochlamys debaryana TaxID=47281 RepID=A0A835XGP6_9CHLO|nr:hypothetical protein HYH03_017714 [Edaphochlamys debaryana]|eukprot:KAG2483406.1 hypothetical protein HYH03_017714 [Edaphochlamys debaryana]